MILGIDDIPGVTFIFALISSAVSINYISNLSAYKLQYLLFPFPCCFDVYMATAMTASISAF